MREGNVDAAASDPGYEARQKMRRDGHGEDQRIVRGEVVRNDSRNELTMRNNRKPII